MDRRLTRARRHVAARAMCRPCGSHCIRHCGLPANGSHKASLASMRALLGQPREASITPAGAADCGIDHNRQCFVCAHCGSAKIIVQTFARGESMRAPPVPGFVL
jgi:hypothetical protein